MEEIIQELTTYFESNQNKLLQDFLPRFKNINIPLFLKKQPLIGTYSKDILFRNKLFEIVFITWGANSQSPIHSHPSNGCILQILDGDLVEERYNKELVLFEYNFLKSKDIGYMDNSFGTHRIINNNNHNVYSFHIYSPPNFYT